jgi:hypothetical protein
LQTPFGIEGQTGCAWIAYALGLFRERARIAGSIMERE